MKEIEFVRQQLEKSKKDWESIALATDIHPRTIYNVLNQHVQVKYSTVEKLFDYFKSKGKK